MHIDVLDWKPDDDGGIAVLRVAADLFSSTWSALSMYGGSIAGQQARFEVIKTSSHLIGVI